MRQYLFMMLGFPGSGKSFVSDWLAKESGAVHLRADDLRLAMFGADRLALHRDPKIRRQLYGAMDYMTQQTLRAGGSVIYDANLNFLRTRDKLRQFAGQEDATAVIVWVRVPIEIARQRVLERAKAGEHQLFEDGVAFVDRMAGNLQQPVPHELVVELDGLADEATQKAAFTKQLQTIMEQKHD